VPSGVAASVPRPRVGHGDDGGFTGANLERPALQRLIAGIEARQIDCVLVYKVDRL
jgi:site-specific DNA recombinase